MSLWLVGLGWVGMLMAQGAEQTLQLMESALRRGDAVQVARLLAPQVEIFLSGSPRIYSSMQARYVLQEFFRQNPPRTFTLLHKGRSENILYAIGSYISTEGRWDVSFFTRFHQGRYLVEQIRFEPVGE
ncbi:MAG: DUF4783 domain-containing protein [Bacteroidia bacterium]|nr:DUF4783 domain-containing protein [Bacteroidia bacterium]MDW8236614.1 DUF4783 domain-containing protein [Bacteroidia bacterium]